MMKPIYALVALLLSIPLAAVAREVVIIEAETTVASENSIEAPFPNYVEYSGGALEEWCRDTALVPETAESFQQCIDTMQEAMEVDYGGRLLEDWCRKNARSPDERGMKECLIGELPEKLADGRIDEWCRVNARVPDGMGLQVCREQEAPEVIAWFSRREQALARKRVLLAERTVWEVNTAEIRMRCVKWAKGDWPWGGGWKMCVGHAYDQRVHQVKLQMYGPSDMNAGQIDEIKNSCLVGALTPYIASTGWGALIDVVASALVGKFPVLDEAFRSCIETTEFLGRVAVPEFALVIKKRKFWTNER